MEVWEFLYYTGHWGISKKTCIVMNLWEKSSSKSGLEGENKQGDSLENICYSSNIITNVIPWWLWELKWSKVCERSSERFLEKKSTKSDNWLGGESKDQDKN